MITCTLRDKKYSVDFISGRALREMEPAAQMYAKSYTCPNWPPRARKSPRTRNSPLRRDGCYDPLFCILFQNQFTPDDVLDNYPVDRLMHDIALALMAVQTQTTDVLSDFPTKAAEATPQTEAAAATA